MSSSPARRPLRLLRSGEPHRCHGQLLAHAYRLLCPQPRRLAGVAPSTPAPPLSKHSSAVCNSGGSRRWSAVCLPKALAVWRGSRNFPSTRCLEGFAQQVRAGLEQADRARRREIIRSLVKRIEIDQNEVTVVYRVDLPPFEGGPTRGFLPLCEKRAGSCPGARPERRTAPGRCNSSARPPPARSRCRRGA